MEINKVWATYYSATGTTEKIVNTIAETLAALTGAQLIDADFTLPEARTEPLSFGPGDLVVFGTPVYAGRIPNVLLKYLATLSGNGALAVPVVLFGNRDYDDGLIELRDLMEKGGLKTVAAGAFVGEHSFSDTLAQGRPDQEDLTAAVNFARSTAEKIATIKDPDALAPITVKGIPDPYRGYYQPRDRQGSPVDIRKVKPLTRDTCDNCLICAKVCPMGSISLTDVRELTGICIKCGACIKKCPKGAKYFDDPGFLYHKTELEEGLQRRAEPELFL